MADAPDTASYITVFNESVTLPNSRQLEAGDGITLEDAGSGQTLTIDTSGFLNSVATAPSNGFLVKTGTTTAAQRTITGDDTVTVVNPDGVSGNVIIGVNNNTSIQQVQASLNGTLVGAGDILNFIPGAGAGVNVIDSGNSLDITFTASGSGAPTNATYWVSTQNPSLSNETNIGSLNSGILSISSTAGTATPSSIPVTITSDNTNFNLGIGTNTGTTPGGQNNTFIGNGVGSVSTSSTGGTYIGKSSGSSQLSYTNCTFVGNGADATVNALTNANAIGQGASVSTSNTMVLGKSGTTTVIGGSASSGYASLELNPAAGTASAWMGRSPNPTAPANGGIFSVSNSDNPFFTSGITANSGQMVTAVNASASVGQAQSLLVGNGNNYSCLIKGSANQILQMDETGTNITWGSQFFDDPTDGLLYIGSGSGNGTGSNDVIAIGSGASANSPSNGVVSIGTNAARYATGFNAIVAVGTNALSGGSVGGLGAPNAVAVGNSALLVANSTPGCTVVGSQAASTQAAYGLATLIGFGADATSSGLNNIGAIGAGAQVGHSDQLALGGQSGGVGQQVTIGMTDKFGSGSNRDASLILGSENGLNPYVYMASSNNPNPSNIASGDGIFSVNTNTPKFTTSSGTVTLCPNPMTSPGDLIVGGSGGSSSRLGIGSNNQVLTVNAGAPIWQSLPSIPLMSYGSIGNQTTGFPITAGNEGYINFSPMTSNILALLTSGSPAAGAVMVFDFYLTLQVSTMPVSNELFAFAIGTNQVSPNYSTWNSWSGNAIANNTWVITGVKVPVTMTQIANPSNSLYRLYIQNNTSNSSILYQNYSSFVGITYLPGGFY